MAPSLMERYYYSSCGYNDCYYSTWDSWGRWVALVLIIAFVLLVACLFSCVNARRRRRAGLAPRYGTGWTTNTFNRKNDGQNNGQYYNNQPYGGAAPAPPYSPPAQNQQYTGNTFNNNEGYYGQQSGIELQHPQNTYTPQRAGDNVYSAPQGAPPNKY